MTELQVARELALAREGRTSRRDKRESSHWRSGSELCPFVTLRLLVSYRVANGQPGVSSQLKIEKIN